MACASSPTAVMVAPASAMAPSTSACRALVSWYSSTSTWSKRPATIGPASGSCTSARQQGEQVVVVDQVPLALAGDVGAVGGAQLVGLVGAPRVVLAQHGIERLAGVDHPAEGAGQQLLAGPAALRGRVGGQLVPHQGEEVGLVTLVEEREVGVDADRAPVAAEQAVGDGVERAAPGAAQLVVPGPLLGAGQQLGGGPPAEGEQQDALGRDPVGDQVGEPGRQRRGLAGAGAGHDEQAARRRG